MYYIYFLRSSIDNLIFYVGKGSGTRMYKHLEIASGTNEKAKARNPHLYRKINEIVNSGGNVICEKTYESRDESEVYLKEEETIEKIGLENLTNIRPGGRGGKGGKKGPWSEERKLKFTESLKGRILKPRPMSQEQKDKLSKACKGKPSHWKGKKLSEETREKMRISGKGKNKGPISEKRRLSIIEGLKKYQVPKLQS